MNLLFIPSLLQGDMKSFLLKLSMVFLMWLIVFIASLVDLKTGIDGSKRLGCFKTTSRGLRQTIKKDLQYFMLLVVGLLFDFVLSYLTTLSDILPILGIFRIPIFSILGVLVILIIEGISVKENLEKGKNKEIISPELITSALDIIGVLGDDKIKAIAELLKPKEEKK